jgi:hypothetical protein
MGQLVTFYAQNRHDRANSAYVKLPPATAHELLSTLAYRVPGLPALDNPHGLLPEQLLARIYSVRRQFTLGRLREFTSDHVDEAQLLVYLQELERVALQALINYAHVLVISACDRTA